MQLSGTAAGVPFLALPPANGPRPDAPVVVAYHLLDAPRTETAFASAVPLDGLDAWKVYFGLPLSGSRLPEGGTGPLIMEDPVLALHQYVTLGAAQEFPAAYASALQQLHVDPDVPFAVLGGSMGGVVAQLVAADTGRARAAVLINPVVRFRTSIDALSAHHGRNYRWTPEADAVAERLDFIRRAGELTGIPIRYVTGADDMVDAIVAPVIEATRELRTRGGTVDHQVVPDMGHALAEEPGTDAAPQTPHALVVDRLAVEWFQRHF